MSYPTSIDPSVVSYFNSKVAENPYDQTLGQLQYVDPKTGLQYFGRFEQGPYGGEGSTPAMKLTGYSVGNYETAKGGQMGVYDLAGKYTGKNEDWEADDWNYDTQAMMAAISFGVAFAAAAAAAGGAASGAGGGTAAGPDFTAGFTDTGTAGGALDSYAGSAAVTEPAGSTLLTGPTSVSADYNLLTGTNISDPSGVGFGLEGNAGQGINVAGRSGDGLVMNQSGNLPAMGGGQGLTTTGTQVMGDAGSFINNPAYQLEGAGNTIISEGGIYTPQSPYTPDLGDPNSFINRPAPDVPTGPADLPISDPSLLDKIKDILDPTKVLDPTKILPTILPPLIQKLLEPPEEQPPQPVTFTPEQPFVGVGAGEYTQANAQGGAAGSMAGVAGTLLTAKDTFGYGRTMLA